MKLKTAGLVHPKVPIQAITTLVVAALAYFGVDLDPEASAAIGVVGGFIAGYFAPAAPTVTRRVRKREAGYGLIELLFALVLLILLVWLILALVR